MLKPRHIQKGGNLGISMYVAGYVRETGFAVTAHPRSQMPQYRPMSHRL